MNPPEHFDTPRLVIRRARPADAGAVFERWTLDAGVAKFLTWKPHRTLVDTEAFLACCSEAWDVRREFVWMLAEPATGRLLGSIAAAPGDHGVNVGYLLARDAWGRGLMAEALARVSDWWLAQPEIFRVWAVCHPENEGSVRVLEKAGFAREGLLRRWDVYPNLGEQPMDSLCFSRVV